MRHYRNLSGYSLRIMCVPLFLGAVLLLGMACDSPAFADDPEGESPFVIEPAHFRLSNPQLMSGQPIKAASTAQGWAEIMTEDFEGPWPASGWAAFDGDDPPGLNGEYYWGVTDCFDYGASGDHDAVPHAAGADASYTCWQPYPPNLNSWMVYGPFDLSNATAAELYFYFWLDSEKEHDWFYWMASLDGAEFYGPKVSGQVLGGWTDFDLAAVPTPNGDLIDCTGQPQVWIAFAFTSDDHVDADHSGAWLDDIALRYKVSLLFQIYLPLVLRNHPP